MYRLLATHLCLAVLAALCDTPFLHLHDHAGREHAREAHHGNAPALHRHQAASRPASSQTGMGMVAWDNGDDDAVFLSWLHSGPQAKLALAVSLPVAAAAALPGPALCGSVAPPAQRSHDPPGSPSTVSRAPPFCTPAA